MDYLQYHELKTDELEHQRFRNWNEKSLRDNRVGANKQAKMEARRWVNEVSGEALFDCYLTVRSREVRHITHTVLFHLNISIFRTYVELENQIFPNWKIYFRYKREIKLTCSI